MFNWELGSALSWLAASVAEDSVIAAAVSVVTGAVGVISVSSVVCAGSTFMAEDSLPKRGLIVASDTISVVGRPRLSTETLANFPCSLESFAC